MKAFQQIGLGLSSYGKALEMIFSKKLILYMLFPLALNILLYIGGQALMTDLKEYVWKLFYQQINFQNADFFMSKHLDKMLAGIIWILFEILFFIAFTYIGGYIIIALLSPVFSNLSEKTEKIINGNDYPFQLSQTIKDIGRSLLLTLKNFLIQTGLTIVLFIIGFIPVIGWLAPIFLFLINSYYFGFGFMDFTCERYKMDIKQSMKIIKNHKWAAITLGAVFSFSLFIPFCGVALSAFISVISVIAATVLMLQILPNPLTNNPVNKNS